MYINNNCTSDIRYGTINENYFENLNVLSSYNTIRTDLFYIREKNGLFNCQEN